VTGCLQNVEPNDRCLKPNSGPASDSCRAPKGHGGASVARRNRSQYRATFSWTSSIPGNPCGLNALRHCRMPDASKECPRTTPDVLLRPAGGQETRHQETSDVAHVPAHLHDPSSCQRRRRQSGAGVVATQLVTHHDGHLRASADARETEPPGFAIGLVALVATLMSIHEHMQGWQKAIWMILIGLLLIVETRSIKVDRARADAQALKDRENQDGNFRQLAWKSTWKRYSASSWTAFRWSLLNWKWKWTTCAGRCATWKSELPFNQCAKLRWPTRHQALATLQVAGRPSRQSAARNFLSACSHYARI
jgi:hypothetical protein